MPIDPMFTEPILGTFRGMMAEIESKGLDNADAKAMKETLARMEALTQEKDDLNEFNAAMMHENLYMKFSDFYGKALAGEAQAQQEEKGYDDAGLLKQSLDALRSSIESIRVSLDTYPSTPFGQQQRRETEMLIPPIEELVAFGESCPNLPTFLREQIVRGLDKATEGSGVAKRGLELEVKWAKQDYNPVMIAHRQKLLDTFEAMEKVAAFGVVDNFEFSLERRKIDHEFAPALAEWDQVTDRWERLIDVPLDWLEAHCGFAPYDDRWRDQFGRPEVTERNIRRTKGCGPYYLEKREEILNRYTGLTWDTFWAHPTYQWAWERVNVYYSAGRIELLKAAYPHCKPGAKPPADLIAKAEELREQKRDQRYVEIEQVKREAQASYDAMFGAGSYASTFASRRAAEPQPA